MSNKRFIKTIGCALCMLACSFILFGCSNEKPKQDIVTLPADISAIADFKCVCSINHETEFVIENDAAKELYTYITEQWEKAKETEVDRTEQDQIYLSFQDGEPMLILNQEPNVELSDDFIVSKKHFYGVFWICENDYMVFTATPMTSFQRYYKLPNGTYERVLEMVTK